MLQLNLTPRKAGEYSVLADMCYQIVFNKALLFFCLWVYLQFTRRLCYKSPTLVTYPREGAILTAVVEFLIVDLVVCTAGHAI